MTLLIGLALQAVVPAVTNAPPTTITIEELQSKTPQELAAVILGLAGSRVVERQVRKSSPPSDDLTIIFASEPANSGWGGLCHSDITKVTFSDRSRGITKSHRLDFARLSTGVMYRLLARDAGASARAASQGDNNREHNRACGGSHPILGTRDRPGFFKFECGWMYCGAARHALFAARAVARSATHLDTPDYMRCRSSRDISAYCATAQARARRAIIDGFELLSLRPCRDDEKVACVVGTIFRDRDQYNVDVEMKTTALMDPDRLVPDLVYVTGIAIDAYTLPPA